jgi:hypothetical protein
VSHYTFFLLAAALVAGSIGCSRERRNEEPPLELPVEVRADSGPMERLRVEPPAARAWIAEVTPSRLRGDSPPLPAAPPDTALPEPPPLRIDRTLKPPILRDPATLVLPAGPRAANASVELEVRVDEAGGVSAVRWAGGVDDTALVAAAERCARSMRFYPALWGDRPVAVWCRQRFDFRAR